MTKEQEAQQTQTQEDCEFCNGQGFRDVELPADMGNHTTEDCQWCKGTGNDNSDNIYCESCGLWWNELVIARGQAGNIHACTDCGGEWVRV